MSLHRVDRELQIKLAELQADIQISLGGVFGFLAVIAGLGIGFHEINFILEKQPALLALASRILIILLVAVSAYGMALILGDMTCHKPKTGEALKRGTTTMLRSQDNKSERSLTQPWMHANVASL